MITVDQAYASLLLKPWNITSNVESTTKRHRRRDAAMDSGQIAT
jgi:hypothetical protein